MSSSRACVRRPAPRLLCSRRWPRFSPFPSPQKGRQQWSPATAWVGWALTLCLCSYDERFSGGPQVVARLGVLRFGHRLGCVCCGVPPLSIPPPPCVDTPTLLFDGVPLFCVGGGCLLQPPLFVCPTPLFVHTPGLDPIVYGDIHLSHRERPDTNYIERRNYEPGSHHHRHGSVGAGADGLADRTAAHLAAGR